MFKVSGIPILEDDLTVLNELKNQLELQGIYRFATFKVGPNNIQFNCPIHNDGMEKKPSCGISTVDKKDHPAGTVHCFSCGYTATLEQMISDCFGYTDNGRFGKDWLLKNFVTISIESRKDISLDFNREAEVTKNNYISDHELDAYRYYHPYMYKRKLTNEIIEIFDVGYDKKNQCITFPVRDRQGNTLFIARRSVNIKFFNYPTGVEKPVYGLYEWENFSKANEVIICESIINALTCWSWGKAAFALNGTGTEYQVKQLLQLPIRKYILGLDPDAAGQRGAEKLKKALMKHKIVTSLELPAGKDINDLEKEEFEKLVEIF